MLLLAVFLVALDQASKYIATEVLPFVCNRGSAFGIPAGSLIYSFAVLLLVLLLIYFENSKRNILGLSLIFAGGFSNFADRVIFGCVRDFVNLRVFPVFNLADVEITFGVVLIIYSLLLKKNET